MGPCLCPLLASALFVRGHTLPLCWLPQPEHSPHPTPFLLQTLHAPQPSAPTVLLGKRGLYSLVPTFSLLINPLGCLLTALGAPSLTEPWLALALAIPLHLTVLMSSVSESPPPLTPLPGLRVLPEVAYSLSDKPRRQIWK